jgi:hypothetical protein
MRDMACPDCWHPHLHAASWHPLNRHDDPRRNDPDPDKLICPVCHPLVGSAEFVRHAEAVTRHVKATAERRAALG